MDHLCRYNIEPGHIWEGCARTAGEDKGDSALCKSIVMQASLASATSRAQRPGYGSSSCDRVVLLWNGESSILLCAENHNRHGLIIYPL